MIWLHKHVVNGRVVVTRGEGYSDCAHDRGCWFTVADEEAATWWLRRGAQPKASTASEGGSGG